MDTRRRDPVYTWPVATVLLCLAAFGLTSSWPRRGELWDLGSFLLAGYSANRGIDPYSRHYLTEFSTRYEVSLTVPNLNPPISVPIFQCFSALPPNLLLYLCFCISLVILTSVAVILVRTGPGHKFLRMLWSLASTGLWMTLALGQTYAPLVALSALAHQSEKQKTLSGISIGIVSSVKPNFLVWPGLLLLAGHVRVAVTAVTTFVLLWGAALLALGHHVYVSWFEAVGAYHSPAATNMSLVAWLGEVLPTPVVLVVAISYTLAISFASWKWRPSYRAVTDVALCSSLLLAPVAWVSYAEPDHASPWDWPLWWSRSSMDRPPPPRRSLTIATLAHGHGGHGAAHG